MVSLYARVAAGLENTWDRGEERRERVVKHLLGSKGNTAPEAVGRVTGGMCGVKGKEPYRSVCGEESHLH